MPAREPPVHIRATTPKSRATFKGRIDARRGRLFYDATMLCHQAGLDVHELRAAAARAST
jgi:hypothetical protein